MAFYSSGSWPKAARHSNGQSKRDIARPIEVWERSIASHVTVHGGVRLAGCAACDELHKRLTDARERVKRVKK
jgi:hypothetical protein